LKRKVRKNITENILELNAVPITYVSNRNLPHTMRGFFNVSIVSIYSGGEEVEEQRDKKIK